VLFEVLKHSLHRAEKTIKRQKEQTKQTEHFGYKFFKSTGKDCIKYYLFICTWTRAALTREELVPLIEESDVVVQAADLLLQILHALLLVGLGRSAGGGHEHRPQHLLVGFGQRPGEMTDLASAEQNKKGANFQQEAMQYLNKYAASSESISSGQSLTLSSKTATTSSWAMKGAAGGLLRPSRKGKTKAN